MKYQNLSKDAKSRIRRYAIGIPIFIGLYLVLVFLSNYPLWPKDAIGWIFIIFVGIPLSLCVEWLGELVFKKKILDKKVSFKRLLFALLIFICLFVCSIGLWLVFEAYFRQHFI
jgi:heme/copper-type cytochrome/quinol oxidase subunit 4